jgi:hypothetical protein
MLIVICMIIISMVVLVFVDLKVVPYTRVGIVYNSFIFHVVVFKYLLVARPPYPIDDSCYVA